ncbi:hypothetical protein FOA52_000915 [Chlamydomonas sp. UWO 241]|nr:hypothetical protein FOA52_000915 [Chlamydomonas sp. UWO 241]
MNISDIPGARSQSHVGRFMRREHTNEHEQVVRLPAGPFRPLNLSDIQGAAAPRESRGHIDTLGRGTLSCADIAGARPSTSKHAPATPKFQFGNLPRVTRLA